MPHPHLLRGAPTRLRRDLLGLLVAAFAWALIAMPVATLFGATDAGAPTDSPVELAGAALAIAGAIPAVVLAIVLVHRAPPRYLLSVTGRPRPWLFVAGAAIAPAAYLPMLVNRNLLGGTWQGLGEFLPFLIAITLTIPLAAAAEELVFRGYLMQVIGTWTSRIWVPALITSVLFAAAHGGQNGWLFADRLLFGLALCWLTWRTGGLEAAIAIHVAYNVLLQLPAAATGRIGEITTASHAGALPALASMAGTALVVLLVGLLADRRRVTR